MDFSDNSDDEPSVAYEDYCFTPSTDPSSVKSLWQEHFRRPVKHRNCEVSKAFKAKCSIYQFMFPKLSKTQVISKLTNELKGQPKISKKAIKLEFQGIDIPRSKISMKLVKKKGPLNNEWKIESELNKTEKKKRNKNVNKVISSSTKKSPSALPSTKGKRIAYSQAIDENFVDFKVTDKNHSKHVLKEGEESKSCSVKQYKKSKKEKAIVIGSKNKTNISYKPMDSNNSSDLEHVLKTVDLTKLVNGTSVKNNDIGSVPELNCAGGVIKENNIKAYNEKKIVVKGINVEHSLTSSQKKQENRVNAKSDKGNEARYIYPTINLKVMKIPNENPFKQEPHKPIQTYVIYI